jgi:hypothetical protein
MGNRIYSLRASAGDESRRFEWSSVLTSFIAYNWRLSFSTHADEVIE